MARLTDLPALDPADIDGTETVPAVKDSATYRTTVAALGQAAAAQAQSTADALSTQLLGVSPLADPMSAAPALDFLAWLSLVGWTEGKFPFFRFLFHDIDGDGDGDADRANVTIAWADDPQGTINLVDICTFQVSADADYEPVDGVNTIAFVELNDSGVTGLAGVNWNAMTAQLYGGTFANAGISTLAFVDNPAFDRAARNALAKGSALLSSNAKSEYAARVVRDGWVLGAEAAYLKNIIVSQDSLAVGDGWPGFAIILGAPDGSDLCNVSHNATGPMSIADFIATELPDRLRLHTYFSATKTGARAHVLIDKAALVEGTFTFSPLEGEIDPARCLSGRAMAGYLSDDTAERQIVVGAGAATLRAAIDGIKIDPYGAPEIPSDFQSLVREESALAHPRHRIAFTIESGRVFATDLIQPEWTEIWGQGAAGPGFTEITHEVDGGGAGNLPLIQSHRSSKIGNVLMRSDAIEAYCDHIDNVDRHRTQGADGRGQWPTFTLRRGIRYRGGPDHVGALVGVGITDNQTIRFDWCDATHEKDDLTGHAGAVGFFIHNTGPTVNTPAILPSVKSSTVIFNGCSSGDQTDRVVYLQTLDASVPATCIFESPNQFRMILQEVGFGVAEVVTERAADRHAWRFLGTHDGPFNLVDATGAWVLSVPPGTSIGGPLASVLFGTDDEHGRGDLWIKDGSARSLGARLGNRTGNTDALILNGQSWTPDTDLTDSSNAAIRAAIAAATGVVVSETDIGLEQYPDTGFTRRFANGSGATIPSRRFVKRTGAGLIALAEPGDRILGWTIRPIRDGDFGAVVTTRRIHVQQIEGAAANEGEWGLGVGGTVDFAAAMKLGTVFADLLEIG